MPSTLKKFPKLHVVKNKMQMTEGNIETKIEQEYKS